MKLTTRTVALLLSVLMLVSVLSSCYFEIPWITTADSAPETSAEAPRETSEAPKATEAPTETADAPKATEAPTETTDAPKTTEAPKETSEAPKETEGPTETTKQDSQVPKAPREVTYPSVSVSSFNFTLTDADLFRFAKKVTAARAIFDKGSAGNADEFEAVLYELLSLQAEIQTQCDVAYMLYLYDMSNDTAWDNYLYAFNLKEDAAAFFWAFYDDSKKYTHALSDVFREVVLREYEGRLVTKQPIADTYERKMTELEGEYNAIKDSNAGDQEVFEVYKKYMVAAYGLAVNSESEHYYDYSSRHIYNRNDTSAQREALRKYTKEYLIPLCIALRDKSRDLDSQLSGSEFAMSDRYLKNPYDSFGENYLFRYFSSLPSSAGRAMREAFTKDRVFVGDKTDSYNSAMVYKVGNTPICYFHESELMLDTVAHELGHYYANVAGEKEYYAYDLCEVHSTANAMLLYSYLSDELGDLAIRSTEYYLIYSWSYQMVMSVIKDEFDERIYARDPSGLTLEDLQRIAQELIDEYSLKSLSGNAEEQLMTYWRRLGIAYPMSNYCYATAFVTALQIYLKSKDDYAAASEIYRRTVEEVCGKGDFVATIVNAGLTTPYDEATYTELRKLIWVY